MNKVSAFHKDILAKLVSGKSAVVSFDTALAMNDSCPQLIGSGFDASDTVTLTSTHLTSNGWSIGRDRAAELAARRTKQNSARKARDGAMRSLGMTKTKYGWE